MPGWLRVVAIAVGIVVVLVGVLWAFQRRVIYQPDPSPPGPVGQFLAAGQDVTLRTDDGLDLAAWYVPARGGCRSTVLIAPGNAGNRSSRAPLARALADRGLGVLLMDYRGYGGNPGRPDEAGLLADAEAAHRFLAGESSAAMGEHAAAEPGREQSAAESGREQAAAEPGHEQSAAESGREQAAGEPGHEQSSAAPGRAGFRAAISDSALIYYGESLGAAVMTGLAGRHPPAALVLRSPFTDLAAAAEVAVPFLPVRRMLWDQWPLADTVSRITVPTTVIYGTADTVIPPELSLAVAEAAAGPTSLIAVPGADHNDRVLLDGPAVIDAVLTAAENIDC